MIEFVTGLAAGCVITGVASYAIYRSRLSLFRAGLKDIALAAKENDKEADIFAQRLCTIIDHFSKGKSGTARLVVKMAKGEAA